MTLKMLLVAVSLLGAPKETAPLVAAAVSKYAHSPNEAAFLIAWARHESEFSPAIAAGKCERWQCDARRRADGSIEHLARGLFQLHKRAAGADWDLLPGNVDAQVRSAARMTRWALGRCKGDARCAFRVLGGLQPDAKLKGEDQRMATFERMRRAL